MENGFNRAWLEVDLSRSRHNFRRIKLASAPCDVLTVLKADGYGLGARPIAEALIEEGASRIGVATAKEAMDLYTVGAQIQILSAIFPEELEDVIHAGIEVPITDLESARAIGAVATRLGTKAKCHIKLDAGMGRLGILAEEALDVVPRCAAIDGIDIVGIFGHFPLSCEHNYEACLRQLEWEKSIILSLQSEGLKVRWIHAANSDAIAHFPLAAQPPFNLVRAGLILHGLVEDGETPPPWMHNVASFRSRIAAVRTLPKGRTVGYGATFTLDRPMRIGTVAAGYADGVPLAASNKLEVIVAGRRCPIVGRISMDYTTVDLTDVPDVKVGDVATFFGTDGVESIPILDWARVKGVHPYDIICSISPRVARIYMDTH